MKIKEILTENTDLTPEDVVKWFDSMYSGGYGNLIKVDDVEVTSQGVVFNRGLNLYGMKGIQKFPWKIYEVKGDVLMGKGPDGRGGRIKSMENFPSKIEGDLNLGDNLIKKYLPIEVGGDINLAYNNLTTIDGIQKTINGYLTIQGNKITSLKGIGEFRIKSFIQVHDNPVKDSILGLMKIPGITFKFTDDKRYKHEENEVVKKFHNALVIISKHTGQGQKGILAAQNELIENDLEEYAEF